MLLSLPMLLILCTNVNLIFGDVLFIPGVGCGTSKEITYIQEGSRLPQRTDWDTLSCVVIKDQRIADEYKRAAASTGVQLAGRTTICPEDSPIAMNSGRTCCPYLFRGLGCPHNTGNERTNKILFQDPPECCPLDEGVACPGDQCSSAGIVVPFGI